jgi:hypothetical protein
MLRSSCSPPSFVLVKLTRSTMRKLFDCSIREMNFLRL